MVAAAAKRLAKEHAQRAQVRRVSLLTTRSRLHLSLLVLGARLVTPGGGTTGFCGNRLTLVRRVFQVQRAKVLREKGNCLKKEKLAQKTRARLGPVEGCVPTRLQPRFRRPAAWRSRLRGVTPAALGGCGERNCYMQVSGGCAQGVSGWWWCSHYKDAR